MWIKLNKKKYKDLFCTMPFEYVQIDPSGWFYICCPLMVKSVGNLSNGLSGFMECWNSKTAKDIRRSILDGSFKYCNKDTCNLFKMNLLQNRSEVRDIYLRKIIDQKIVSLDKGPSIINLAYDKSCNLACPSCRNKTFSFRNEDEWQEVINISKKVFGPHIKDVKRFFVSGGGDPFASKSFLNFLRGFDPDESPLTRIQLSTNGLLLNQKMWDSICNRAIDCIDVSIDAATPETYKINRGADFGKLLENLKFLSYLYKKGDISYLALHFVVQKNNFNEMPQFVELALNMNCSAVHFKQVLNWGTYSKQKYNDIAIQNARHPDHYKFLEILKHNIFKNTKVNFNDLSHLVKS